MEQPKSAASLQLLLRAMGIDHAEPRVLHALLELAFRTTADCVDSAATYAAHAGHPGSIAIDDVKLAIQARAQTDFVGPPPRDIMAEIAAERNNQPLPLIPERFGVRLPPERHCLLQPSYKVIRELAKPPDMRPDAPVINPLLMAASNPVSPTNAMDQDDDYENL